MTRAAAASSSPTLLAQRTTQWERGDDPMTQFTFTGDYDDYGQPRSQISIAVPRGPDYRRTIRRERTAMPARTSPRTR